MKKLIVIILLISCFKSEGQSKKELSLKISQLEKRLDSLVWVMNKPALIWNCEPNYPVPIIGYVQPYGEKQIPITYQNFDSLAKAGRIDTTLRSALKYNNSNYLQSFKNHLSCPDTLNDTIKLFNPYGEKLYNTRYTPMQYK